MSTGSESMRARTAEPGEALQGDAPGLFVRKSSGLVRELGWRDALSVALSGINPATVVAIFGVAIIPFATDADLTWPYIVAALAMVPLAVVYAQLVAALPRSGGDFVYFGRIFHPLAGAMVGGAFLLFFIFNLATNASFVGQLFLPQFVDTLGDVFSSTALTDFSETLSTSKTAFFITGSVITVLGCLIGCLGARALTRVMFWCFVAGVVAVLILIFQALTHDTADFRAAYDEQTLSGAYQNVIAGAEEAGVATGATFSGFLSMMPFAALGFWGFQIANFPAGEMKRPGRTYLISSLAGVALAVVFFVVSWLALRHLAGREFLQAAAGLSAADPDAFEEATGGATTLTQGYGDMIAGDSVTRIVMSGGFMLGGLMFPLVMVLVASRLMFALSFDRLLPTKVAEVSTRFHAPLWALLICAIAGIGFVALVVYSSGFLRVTRNSILVWATMMTLAGLAAAFLPYRRRDLFDASPRIVDRTLMGLPAIVPIGVATMVIQGALAVYAATNDSISQGYDAGSIAYLVGSALLGAVLYVVSRAYMRRSKGIDVDLAMRELPPE